MELVFASFSRVDKFPVQLAVVVAIGVDIPSILVFVVSLTPISVPFAFFLTFLVPTLVVAFSPDAERACRPKFHALHG